MTMRSVFTWVIGGLCLAGCNGSGQSGDQLDKDANLMTAESFVDAFYSFHPARLRMILSSAEGSVPEILFYQGWAEGGNYKVLNRMPCKTESARQVSCSITVEDDLIGALGIDFDVTDTFHLTMADGRITSVQTRSDDPMAFHDAEDWVNHERPELVRKPCRGYFDGGPTPGDCVRAMVQGFAEFAATHDFPKSVE